MEPSEHGTHPRRQDSPQLPVKPNVSELEGELAELQRQVQDKAKQLAEAQVSAMLSEVGASLQHDDGLTRAVLRDLTGLIGADDSMLQVLQQHVMPACKHVASLHGPLAEADAALQHVDGEPIVEELRMTERVLAERTDAALAKAKEGKLSDEDKSLLSETREQRAAAVLAAERAILSKAENARKVEQVCSQLTDLQSSLTDALGAPSSAAVPDDFVPASVQQLETLVKVLQPSSTRIGALQHVVCTHARALHSALEELHTLADEISEHVSSSLSLAAGADLAVAVPEALHNNLAARLQRGIEIHTNLAESEETTRRRVAELRQMSTAVEQDMADAKQLPAHEEALVQKRHDVIGEEEALEDLQTKLRRLKKRNRLTPQEEAKHDAAIAEQQQAVAAVRAELDMLQAEIEEMAAYRMPEAVQALVQLRSQQGLPEVLRMLQPTGLYRNRNLATDYEEVVDVHVVSGRYQMRVVRPVGSDERKVLKAFPADMFKQIRNEVVNVARVEHPNVLRPELVFLEEVTDTVFVQYPFVANGSLDRWLEAECVGKVELLSRDGYELLCGVFREVLDGVAHLHANGVVHNDLKPANVLMGDQIVPRICDFELSNSVEVAGTRGLGSMTVRGLTESYAAPEVLENKRSTEKSDMYSLGRLMYDTLLHEWLAQRHDAAAASPAAMMRAHLPPGYDPRTNTWLFPDDVHPAFRDLVERLLSELPALRPSAVEARAHPYFTQRLFADEEEVPALSIQLDVASALPEQQFWETDGSDAELRRIPLDLRSPEAREVATLFRTRGCPRRQVVSIERVENGELLRRFAFHKHHLEAKYGSPVDEQLVFHGTKPGVVPFIAEQGFDMRLNGANGTAYGKGNYFARDSSYSAGGTYSPADAHGVKWMFVARILVGETVRGSSQMRRAERPDGTLVDTAVNNEASPSIYVTFDNGQAMPVYVIGFR